MLHFCDGDKPLAFLPSTRLDRSHAILLFKIKINNLREREMRYLSASSRVAALVCCMAVGGCESVPSLGPATPAEEQALIHSASTTSPQLQPGDKIKVTVFGEDRLSGEYEIDAAGFVSLPLAGTIRAAGLSKQQMEEALARKFNSEYLRNPKVTVDVSNFRPFYIMGEVAKPGEYPFKNGLNVMSATALAGGVTYRAKQSTIQIQHVGEAGFHDYQMSPSIPVLPGDLIRVPQRYF